MILDYTYNRYKKNLGISYITDEGGKRILNFNVDRFKTYYSTPDGKFENWDGSKCDVKWTEKPSTFDIKTYMEELPDNYKKLLHGKTSPKLYSFDIETKFRYDSKGVQIFSEPSEAADEITVISIVSPDLNCIVLGYSEFKEEWKEKLQKQFEDYLNAIPFFKELNIKMPYIKYIQFGSEHDMLEYFLKNIVAKVPVIAGWNSLLFDWQYIQNRIRGYYPEISLNSASCGYTTHPERRKDMKDNDIQLTLPDHTLVLDMMDVIENFDQVVMPLKESMSLDFVSHEMLGANKISYDGDLEQLRKTDFFKYVFYNAIDSILVQLLDKRFKTMSNIYIQALQCKEKIGKCFSKIAISEALVFNYFYGIGKKVVTEGIDIHSRERGRLIGAYVKKPIPGKHFFVACNDFASLYPSTIMTCNISFENYIGAFWDEEKLSLYRNDSRYIVIGPNVHMNSGTPAKPEIGRCLHVFLDEKTLAPYRKDKNYFVSVNGCVYKNDKDYAFRMVQRNLYDDRNAHKYLPKDLDATVMLDIEHVTKGNKKKTHYTDTIIKALSDIGYDIKGSEDLFSMSPEEINKLKDAVKNEIEYLTSYEQACKLNMNSLYGGSSHIAFFWFNINLANDITGEARNLIHMMEHHIPDFWRENWTKMTDVHKMLGIEVDEKKAADVLARAYYAKDDPDAYQNPSYVEMCYGDTDSLYISYNGLLNTVRGVENMSLEQKTRILIDLNTKFMDGHNKEFIEEYYKSRFVKSVHKFELETLNLSGCWLDIKKRYAQLLLWKDGKFFDADNLPLKVKGLEMTKASYPRAARNLLKKVTRFYLEDQTNEYMLQKLNIKMQEIKKEYYKADIEDICANMRVNNYTKYVLDDNNPNGVVTAPKCPANVRALGNYNNIRNVNHLDGEAIYGGKLKCYMYYPKNAGLKTDVSYFAFKSMDYPKWADEYAPVCKEKMFQQYVLDPFNRIIESNGIGTLRIDGSIEMSLW